MVVPVLRLNRHKNALSDFVYDVNYKLMGDFVSMSNDEILRFQKMEKLLENKISRRFKIRRLDKDDFGYLIEHLYGQTGTAYEEYEYHLSKKKLDNETLIKYYDLIKPTRCLVEEKQRYLKIQQEDETVYVDRALRFATISTFIDVSIGNVNCCCW